MPTVKQQKVIGEEPVLQGITHHARHLNLNPEYEKEPLLDCKQRGKTLPFAFEEGGANSSMQGEGR